ncbi:hypothetical protein G7Z17_g3306 [Cylindrodendrum hubeiense]|uniref:Uncharacterized protein n=1 Tax=Cylindrodendrum hubeiense TaxID=595255 RepID=A0A9P5HG56_9HYPO|nr:hypothetical protein G7Z17_g3306 [Cylindrodendrum hubeiense]
MAFTDLVYILLTTPIIIPNARLNEFKAEPRGQHIARTGFLGKRVAAVCPSGAKNDPTDDTKCICDGGATWTSGTNAYTSKILVKGACVTDCGPDAALNKAGACICTAKGAIYDSASNTCLCGDDASLTGGKCVCTDTTATFDTSAATAAKPGVCKCPKGKLLIDSACITNCGDNAKPDDSGECICMKLDGTTPNGATFVAVTKPCSCGPNARLVTASKTCECKDTEAIWDEDTSTCTCTAPQVLVDGFCTTDCGDDATADEDGNCVCKDETATWDTDLQECNCPTGKVLVKSVCVKDCGDQAAVNSAGTCVCKAKGATFATKTKTCGCGSDATLKGTACVCKVKTAIWDPAKAVCNCPTGKKLSGTTCVLDCGANASPDSAGKKCVCKAKGATFATKTKTCGCGSDATLKGTACVCKVKTATWDSTNKVCYCKPGFVYDGKTCSCPKGKTNKGGKCY